MRLNSRLLECFHATVSVGTVTGAADVLNTSQPAVSRSLKQLEDAVGMVLFTRSGNRVTPTDAARLLFHEVDRSFRSVRQIGRYAEEIRNLQQGKVHIAVAPAYSQNFIVSATTAFRQNRGSVHTVMSTRKTQEITDLVAGRQCDIGLTAYGVEPEGTEVIPFTSAPEVCILPVGHPLAQREEIRIADLHGQDFIYLSQIDPYARRLERHLEEHGVRPTPVMEVDNSLIAAEAVSQGLGISIINPFSALDFKRRGVVIRKLEIDLPFHSVILLSKFSENGPLITELVQSLHAQKTKCLSEIAELSRPTHRVDLPGNRREQQEEVVTSTGERESARES
ncbi:LysR substrate-binding domain-containing protein [Frigidibacter sp. MR17.14]|uniref:LysR substrate-binding domain-containing protein n=1 Tax=Frigidibacter sp. MR17.14 TaxID=3126509 RepID=UPI003012D7D8